jgi:hypothetical protein
LNKAKLTPRKPLKPPAPSPIALLLRKLLAAAEANWQYLLAAGIFLLFCLKVTPESRDDSHFYRMVLAFLLLLLLSLRFHFHRKGLSFSWPWGNDLQDLTGWKQKTYFTALLILSIFGTFNYYQFDKTVFGGVGDYADATYYYINSKYFNELGYFDLYPAMLVADSEGPGRLTHIDRYRDLYTYEKVGRAEAFREADRIKGKFSTIRWNRFRQDVDYLVEKNIAGGWSYFFIDHGYNPPPTWTLTGGTLSRLCPVESLKTITLIDLILVALLFALVAKAFGMEVMLFALLFFLTTFSGRWPILGQSILRFDWLVALLATPCLLKMKRFGWAGAFLMYSTLNRIFPAIFFFPILIWMAVEAYRSRQIPNSFKHLAAGSAIAFALLVGLTLIFVGPGSFADAQKNILMHGSAKSFSSHRVGLGDALVFRFETTRSQMEAHGDISGKSEQLEALTPFLYGFGFLSLAFIAFYLIRVRKVPLHETLVLSILPLFILTNPQINYYNLRLLLIFWHAADLSRPRNQIGILLLFGIELISQYTKVIGFERYTTTGVTSLGLGLYLLIMVAFWTADIVRSFPKKPKDAPLPVE